MGTSFDVWLKDFDRYFVGYNDQLKRIGHLHSMFTNTSNPVYPPYNIRKLTPTTYVIEIAVAGFSAEEINIELDDGILKVQSQKTTTPEGEFVHRGIAARTFSRAFALNDDVEVESADIVNGMLNIYLRHNIPESKKPRKIPVLTGVPRIPPNEKGEKQLLTEE
jgi:molecular chaperone IbpA